MLPRLRAGFLGATSPQRKRGGGKGKEEKEDGKGGRDLEGLDPRNVWDKSTPVSVEVDGI